MEISVIIPIYNKQRYLKRLLMQLQNQSFQDFECLLIDDGSSDGSGNICDSFAAQDSRFCVFHIPNGGVSHARNFGISQAAGQYITFIDADDEIHQEYLKNLYSNLISSDADLIIGGYEKFWDDKSKRENGSSPISPGFYTLRQLLPAFSKVQLTSGIYGYCWAKLFSANFIRDIRFDESLHLAEDFDFYLHLYPQIKTIYVDDLPYYRYRQEAENSSVLVQDSEIDYVAQLKVNLHYRDFLVEMSAFTGENHKIVQQRISDYVYFSFFHCPDSELNDRFDYLVQLCAKESIVLTGRCLMQRILLFCLRHQYKHSAKNILSTYRLMRNMRNKMICN